MKKIETVLDKAMIDLVKLQPLTIWSRTGVEIDRVDCYDWSEIVNSKCGLFVATGVISCDELVEVEEIELI